MTDFKEVTPGEFRRTEVIESEIRQTRDRMGNEIEAIGDRLRPARIKQRAKDAISQKGANLFRTAKENPVPTAIVALGLALLFKARTKHQESGTGYAAGQSDFDQSGIKEKAQEFAGAAGERVSHAAEQVSEKAKRTGSTLQRFFERNPIIAGAGVIVLGAAVGALIPETKQENQLMGHARDQMLQQARSVAQHAQGALEQKMSEQHPSTQTQGQSHGSYQRQ
jgi:hypothetical protein